MLRRLFTLASALSLLLCLSACALWVRSYGVADQFEWHRVDHWDWLRTAKGHLEFGTFLGDCSRHPPDFYGLKYSRHIAWRPFNVLSVLSSEPGDKDGIWEWKGFAWYERRAANGEAHITLVAPFWSVVLALAALPLGWTLRRWRSRANSRRRKRLGFCPACGYDLRASPERCPECRLAGAEPSAVDVAAHRVFHPPNAAVSATAAIRISED